MILPFLQWWIISPFLQWWMILPFLQWWIISPFLQWWIISPFLQWWITFSAVVNGVIQLHADRTGAGIPCGFRRQQTQVTALGICARVCTWEKEKGDEYSGTPNERPPWWDHPDTRPLWWETTTLLRQPFLEPAPWYVHVNQLLSKDNPLLRRIFAWFLDDLKGGVLL